MPRKPKQDQLLSTINPDTGALELHVTGNLLPCAIYNRILATIKANQEGTARPVHFFAYSLDMYLLLRESVPRECYAGLELRDLLTAGTVVDEGGRRDAAGM